MPSYNLSLLVKGLLRAESVEQFAKLPVNDSTFRIIEQQIQKAAYSTDSLGGALNFGLDAELFLDALSTSVIDSVSGFRLAPVQTPLIVVDGQIIGLIGENQRLPVSGNAVRYSLEYVKTGAIRVFSMETATGKSGKNEAFISAGLREDVTGCTNKAFVESVVVNDSNMNTVPSAGETSVLIMQTINAALDLIDKRTTSAFVLLVDVDTCASLATITDGSGSPAFPEINATLGGQIANGIRVIPLGHDQLPEADSDGKFCVLFDADGMLLNRGSVYFSRTDDATVELSNTPSSPGTGDLVSLFQADAVGLKSIRTFAVQPIRNCIVKISGVSW